MKQSAKFVATFLSGLSAVSTVFATPTFQYRPSDSDLQCMRGDVERVGKTMHKVINRKNERQTKPQAST